MADTERMSLQAFWEAVEQRLEKCSADQLRAVLRAMAQQVPPGGRKAFLDSLRPARNAGASVEKKLRLGKLLADIDELAQEIEAATGDADEWADEREEAYGWWDDHEEEDSLGPYERFVEPLAALFDRAQAAFEFGQFVLARAALLDWCLEVVRQRVAAIVGNKHRGSYDKAARLVGACVEVLRLGGDGQAADALVAEVRGRFPRHYAFQSEMDAAVGRARR